jgi:hypothetical protein
MADLFNRNVSNLAGVFTADQAKLQWGALPTGALVQQLNIQYAQTVTRLYGVGETDQYYVGGRTNGQMSVNRVIGPAGSSKTFYATFGDVCKSVGRNIKLQLTQTDCSNTQTSAGPSTYTMDNCVITQVSVGVAAQDMIIGENTNIMYTSLELS